jgi:hypothetical protein
MTKRKLESIGPISVGCVVRVVTDDRPAGIEGTVTRIHYVDGGVMITFKSAEQQEHTQYVAVAVLEPLLHNLWSCYDITVLQPAPRQQSFAGMKPAGLFYTETV